MSILTHHSTVCQMTTSALPVRPATVFSIGPCNQTDFLSLLRGKHSASIAWKHLMRVAVSVILMVSLPEILTGQQVKTATVEQFLGKPTLFVNGVPANPSFYALTHAYGARWSWEEVPQRNLKNFCDMGFRLFQLDLYFEDIWYKEADGLDLEKARRQIRGLLEVCPDAAVVLRIHVNAPFWWNELNPGECTEYANGSIDRRTYGPPFNNEDGDLGRPLRASLASMKWRRESGEKLEQFCRLLANTPEGNSVMGIHIAGGVYGEWHYWGFIDNDPDTGPAMTAYFRQWLRKKYHSTEALQAAWNSKTFSFENASVPDTAERNYTADGIFRDPQKEQRTMDYFSAQQEVVAENIEYFSRLVKASWPRDLIVGVFYGYFHMTFCRQATGGHLLTERILSCPYIDYLSAPQSYWGAAQLAGGSGNSRGVIESAMLHGKLWLDELDNGHIQKKTTVDPVRNTGKYDPEYVPVLRRSAVYPLMRGIGFWYYDFGPRESFGWWDNPVYLKNIGREKQVFDSLAGKPYQPVADVLYVWDQESFLYVKNSWTPVCYNLIDQSFEEALRSGTSGDQVYLHDLEKIDFNRYRVILFMNVYKLTDAQKGFISQKVASGQRTLIWNYMPGYTNGGVNRMEHVGEVTGFQVKPYPNAEPPVVKLSSTGEEYSFEAAVNPMLVIADPAAEILARLAKGDEVVLARKVFSNYTSVYSTLPLHGTDLFRKLFSESGCHIYNTSNDFTYANNGLILLHTKDGGQRTLRLLNGQILEFQIPAYSTWLFDAQTGRRIL